MKLQLRSGLLRVFIARSHLRHGDNDVRFKSADLIQDNADRLTDIDRYNEGVRTNFVASTSYTHANGQLNWLYHNGAREGANLYLDGYTYYYDAIGRVAQIDSYIFGPTTYTYDAQDQLTAATPAYYYAPETYAYDATGNRDAVVQNRTLRDYAVGPGNRITSDGVFTYSYDAEGNLTYRQSIADGSYTIYWYDYRNRILGTGSCTAAGVNTSFSYFIYDAYDRLVRIWRDLDGVGAMAATNTFFVYDGTSILFQFNGHRSQDLANRYLHAEAVDLVLADENLTTDKTHWMLTDHLGTIRHMVNFSYGAWQGARFGMQRAYNAFGQILAQGQSFDTIFAYTGQLLDKPTGMQYHQHRWYNPGIGRWMSEDPTGLTPDVNPARYVGNSSTMAVDRNGLEPERIVGREAVVEVVHQITAGGPPDGGPGLHIVAHSARTGEIGTTAPNSGVFRFSNVGDLISSVGNRLEQADPNTRVRVLEIMYHANPFGGAIGEASDTPKRNNEGRLVMVHDVRDLQTRDAKGRLALNRITLANIQAVGTMLKRGIPFSSNAVIILRGCNSGLDNRPGSLPQLLANAAGVRVLALGGYAGDGGPSFLNANPLTKRRYTDPYSGRPTTTYHEACTRRQRSTTYESADNTWYLFTPIPPPSPPPPSRWDDIVSQLIDYKVWARALSGL